MAKYKRFINDEQWKLLDPLLPKAKPSRKGGRPAIENRQVLEGILSASHRGSLARSAGPISKRIYLLAAAATLGGTRCLARCLAQIFVHAR